MVPCHGTLLPEFGLRDRAKADGGGCDSLSTRTSVMSGIDAPVTQQWKVNWPSLRDFTFNFDQPAGVLQAT